MAIFGSSLPNRAGGFATARTFAPANTGIDAVPRYGGLTIAEGGKSPAMLAQEQADRDARQTEAASQESAAKAEAAWQEAMRLLQRQGPYTPEVVNQLTNRRADQTAAAEAVNAEEIRNTAAARGMDPTQAIRQLQQQRQAANVAFSGDIASNAAIQNFAAETPGRMAAAQANLGRTFTGASTPAVTGGGTGPSSVIRSISTTQAIPQGSSGGYNPVSVHQQAQQQPVAFGSSRSYGGTQTGGMTVDQRNAAQTAWQQSGGRPIGNPLAGGAGQGYVTNLNTGNVIRTTNPVRTPVTSTGAANTAFSGGYYGSTPGRSTMLPY